MSLYKERKKWLKEKRFLEENHRETPTRRCRGQPYLTPKNIVICRIVFSVDDWTYADLKAKKVQFVAPLRSRIYSGPRKIESG